MAIAILLSFEDVIAQQPPYPKSAVINGITWASKDKIIRKAKGSDNWPMTWANDGDLYAAYGDGWGFEPKITEKLSTGFAKIKGTPLNFSGINIRSSDEQYGDGSSGKKASAMLMVDNVLYMWLRNADQSQLAWSTNHAKDWTWSDWRFKPFGYICFINFGRNYSGARDNYVYMYSPDIPSAYEETDKVVLMRVPKERIRDRSSYEFIKALNGDGDPIWTTDISERGAVFTFHGGCNRMDVTYNAGIGRYLMTMRSRAKAGGENQFSIYDAPAPWGPWTTVYYEKQDSTSYAGWGESQHIPSKWISPDGREFYLVFSGGDAFSVIQATITVVE